MSDTYGGIIRSNDPAAPYYSQGAGGHLTLKMLEDAFVTIARQDEENRRSRDEFWSKMRQFHYLLDEKKYHVYLAVYRLVASSIYLDACLHPSEYKSYMKILDAEGIDLRS